MLKLLQSRSKGAARPAAAAPLDSGKRARAAGCGRSRAIRPRTSTTKASTRSPLLRGTSSTRRRGRRRRFTRSRRPRWWRWSRSRRGSGACTPQRWAAAHACRAGPLVNHWAERAVPRGARGGGSSRRGRARGQRLGRGQGREAAAGAGAPPLAQARGGRGAPLRSLQQPGHVFGR